MKQWKGAAMSNGIEVRSNMNENMAMQGFEAMKDG